MSMNSYNDPIFIILGSGGHTTEMCKIIQTLLQYSQEFPKYKFRKILVARTDTNSKMRYKNALEEIGEHFKDDEFIEVPRSREVGQNCFYAILTTLYALIWSFLLIFQYRPCLILCNGPGTCVPFCLAAYIWRFTGRLKSACKLIYIESFCRVENLSLSGKILLYFVDVFVVHWQNLADKYSQRTNVQYFGNIL